MARPSRFATATGTELAALGTYADITKKLQETPDKLIVILFNVRHPDQSTLESRMKTWWKTFETKNNAQFFKCTVVDGQQDVKDKFKVSDPPTVIFFRNGSEIARIDNFEESDPNAPDTSKPGVESNDEKRLKEKIIELHGKK